MDEAVCLQAAVLDWHMRIAAAAQIRVFVEILYDQEFPNSTDGGCRIDPCAVRAYRYHFPYSDTQWVSACTAMARALEGPDPHKSKRYHNGSHKLMVPGVYGTTGDRLYNEREYVRAVKLMFGGQIENFGVGGLSFDSHATGAGDDGHGYDLSIDREPDEDGGMLDIGHACSPFEFVKLDGHPMRRNAMEEWNLPDEQRDVSCYQRQNGGIGFPFPRLVVEVDYSRAELQQSYLKWCLYEWYPSESLLRTKLVRQGSLCGANLRQELRLATLDDMLERMRPGCPNRISDPGEFDPIMVPPHWTQPGSAMAASQNGIVMCMAFPVVELYKRHMRRAVMLAKTSMTINIDRVAIKLVDRIFHTTPDDGVPTAFYEVEQNVWELEDELAASDMLCARVGARLYDANEMRRHSTDRIGFGSLSIMRNGVMFTSDLRMTQIQAMAFELIYDSCASLGKHDSEQGVGETAQVFIYIAGHVALGKTVLTEVLNACIPTSCLELAGTESELSDCENMCNKLIVKDDINLHGKSTEKYQSELSTGVRTHKRNQQHETTNGRVINKEYFARDGNVHVATSNAPLNAAMESRAMCFDIMDDADAAAAKSNTSLTKYDLACQGDVDPLDQDAAGKAMRMQNIWTWRLWKPRNIGLFNVNVRMWSVTVAIMRQVLGEENCLDIRMLQQAKRLAQSRAIKRVTATFQCVVSPLAQRDDDDVDLECLEYEFYRRQAILDVGSILGAIYSVQNTCSDSVPLRQVACAIRSSIVMERGNLKPVLAANDELYMETDLPPEPFAIAERLVGMLTSMKGVGLIVKFVNKLMRDSRGGYPVMKQGTVNGKSRGLLVLRSYFCSTSLVSKDDRDLFASLMAVWQYYKDNRDCEDVDLRANVRGLVAVEYNEPDDPWIVFHTQVKGALCDWQRAPGWLPVDDLMGPLLGQPTDGLTKRITMLGMRPDVLIYDKETGNVAEMEVATPFSEADVTFVPPNSELCRPGGLLIEDYPDTTRLYKHKKVWSNVLAVRAETLFHFHAEAAMHGTDQSQKWIEFCTSALAVEGVVKPGERVALGMGPAPDMATGHPTTSFVYPGVPDDWHLKVKNKRYKWSSSGEDSNTATSFKLFGSGTFTTFKKDAKLWDKVERDQAMQVTGSTERPVWGRRDRVDYLWSEL
ncbi:MAG: hypothetical protein ACPGR8_01130 [Limisphaerales bacterium]